MERRMMIKRILFIALIVINIGLIGVTVTNVTSLIYKQWGSMDGQVEISEQDNNETALMTKIREIKCKLSNDTAKSNQKSQKMHYENRDEGIGIKQVSFNIEDGVSNVYSSSVVKDGVIIMYNNGEKNGMKKINMNGEIEWNCQLELWFKFYSVSELDDGYCVLGYSNDSPIIIKIDMYGEVQNASYIEQAVGECVFVQSDDRQQVEIMGINKQEKIFRAVYDTKGNKIESVNYDVGNICLTKMIKMEDYYYGIGSQKMGDGITEECTIICKIGRSGDEKFVIKLTDDSRFGTATSFNDIAVNDGHIFIATMGEHDIWVMDLTGNDVKKFGYSSNEMLNTGDKADIKHIGIIDNKLYAVVNIGNKEVIDEISMELNHERRINVEEGISRYNNEGMTATYYKILDDVGINVKMHDTYGIAMRQYVLSNI